MATASICFYGQKVANLLLSAESFGYCAKTGPKGKKTKKEFERTRIYNLAGIPMMVRLCDKTIDGASNIDAVIDVVGQQPHDVVPGAFIALAAGAVLKGLDGKPIKKQQLEELLLQPSHGRLKYVMASTRKLCDELVTLIGRRTDPHRRE